MKIRVPKAVQTGLLVLAAPLIAVSVVVTLAVVAIFFLAWLPFKVKRMLVGPPSGGWHRWYAWRPVQIDAPWGEWVVFEAVERCYYGWNADPVIRYRPIAEEVEASNTTA